MRFTTDFQIDYAVTFDLDETLGYPVYWFNLINMSGKNSPRDKKIQYTVICIIEEFFRSNVDVLLYMCDTADNQQAMRSWLFMRWFESYDGKERFITRSSTLRTGGQEEFMAMIVSRNHPYAEQIAELFEAEVALFKNNKP